MPLARRVSRAVPSISSRTNVLEMNDYSKGFNTFFTDDALPIKSGGANLWRYAKNARIPTLGEYDTRKGFDFHSNAAGETQDDTITSTAGAADASFGVSTGNITVEIWSDDSGPSSLLASSSIAGNTLTSSYAYLTARFAEAPDITSASDYWIVAYVGTTRFAQIFTAGATQRLSKVELNLKSNSGYYWSSTTAETTALVSTDSGVSYSATSYAMNFKQHYATSGKVTGLFRARKSDGTKVTLFTQGTTLYSVNNVTGALTAVKTGLNSSATDYQFELVNDIVYYVNGYDGLRKWDFTTESQVSTTNYTDIVSHKGLIFLVSKADPTAIIYSNFAAYETFTSTDFVYAPAPKTGDPIISLESLNGYLLVTTRKNKFILSGYDSATFAIDEAPDQKGSYNHDTVVVDKNYAYMLSDDGVYYTNGSEPRLLSSDVYSDIVNLPNKDTAVMGLSKGRLYLWYTPSGVSENRECYVFSLNFGDSGGTTESLDTKAYVAKAVNSTFDDDALLVGSSRIGQVYWQELDSNDYNNLGGIIEYELETNYMDFGSPAVKKQIRDWQPRFASQTGDYTVSAEYAVDKRDSWTTYQDISVQGTGIVYGGGATYGGGSVYGIESENQNYLYVPGDYRRIALRYKHHAARQPNKFLGHTLVVQSRRLR